MVDWVECGKRRSWPNWNPFPDIHMDGLKKLTKALSVVRQRF